MKRKLVKLSKNKKIKFDRVPTGIKGLDKLIEGGFIKNSVVLVTGDTGTGKTIFSSHFLYEGLKQGETCLYLTLEESPEEIIDDVINIGIDFRKYIKDKKLLIQTLTPNVITDIADGVYKFIDKNKIDRVVIDTISILALQYENPFKIRNKLMGIVKTLKRTGTTSLLTSEISEKYGNVTRFGVEEFLVDGVIVLYYKKIDSQFARAITVWKMRGTNHSQKLHPYTITKNGVIVYSKEESALVRR